MTSLIKSTIVILQSSYALNKHITALRYARIAENYIEPQAFVDDCFRA